MKISIYSYILAVFHVASNKKTNHNDIRHTLDLEFSMATQIWNLMSHYEIDLTLHPHCTKIDCLAPLCNALQ